MTTFICSVNALSSPRCFTKTRIAEKINSSPHGLEFQLLEGRGGLAAWGLHGALVVQLCVD